MAVSFEKFVRWAKNRFGEENVLVKGKEVRLNSIFETDDDGHHLWCSPSGGKKKRKFGVYHCFKTDKKGSLLKLVQIVDNCDSVDAIAILRGQASIRELEQKLEEMLAVQEEVIVPEKKIKLELPYGTDLISELNPNNWWRKKAEEYLSKRKIPIDGLYICTKDPEEAKYKYKGRIIIPYFDKDGVLVYWNARHIGKARNKYMGPPKEIGVGKSDVIYMAGKWPKEGETLYLCEGEFNAKSLALAEFNAGACGGKNMDEKQAILLSKYKIVLCLDRDKAGTEGSIKMSSMITMLSSYASVKDGSKLMYVAPPKGFNDWNDVLVALGPELLHHYIIKSQKPLDFSSPYQKAAWQLLV